MYRCADIIVVPMTLMLLDVTVVEQMSNRSSTSVLRDVWKLKQDLPRLPLFLSTRRSSLPGTFSPELRNHGLDRPRDGLALTGPYGRASNEDSYQSIDRYQGRTWPLYYSYI